ncbi:DUF6286 domain-containing protein [Streptomyces sp. NPDC006704]|uniref:DUF6286 domain-containing protein n=1 Tax=Streptomyces sp. NPDC006704 TaxID=3364760 RepID=UPI003686C36B
MSHPSDDEGATRRLPVIERGAQHGPGSDRAASAADHDHDHGQGHDHGPDDDPVPVLAEGEGGRATRFWSARRIPAGLLALVILAVSGLFLYDVAAVRAHHSAMRWRVRFADWLAAHPLDDVAVLAIAGAAALIGLWLIALAITPGLRGVLTMRSPSPAVRAGLDRAAAALVLRDRAMEVAGVQSARIRVGRRRVTVRALSHFRELDDVRADLDAALGAGLREFGLAGPPALTVRVGPSVRKG